MSTDAAAVLAPASAGAQIMDLRTCRVLRFALGVTATATLAFSIAWPLFFLTPVLTAVFLAKPLPAPSLRDVTQDLACVVLAFALGMALTLFVLPYPLVFVPVLGLVLFHIYYHANRGGSFWLVLLSLIAVLMLPLLGNIHGKLASGVAFYFVVSAGLAVIAVYVAHRLIPDPPAEREAPRPRPFRAGYSEAAARLALKSTAVILPLAVLFFAANLSGQALLLVIAAIFSLSPQLATGAVMGRNTLISTILGGLAALAIYWLLVAVPEIHYFVALMLLCTLLLGAGIFSDRPLAPYLPSAANAILILVASAMDPDVSIADKFGVRVVLLALATVYVVAALAMLRAWTNSRD